MCVLTGNVSAAQIKVKELNIFTICTAKYTLIHLLNLLMCFPETFGTAAVRSIHSRGGGRRGGGYSSGGGFSTGGGNFGGQPPPSYRSNYRQSTFEPTNPTQQMFPAKTRGFQNSQYNRGFQTGNVQHPPNVGYRRGNTTRGGNSY